MNILIPTDFSEISSVAIHYAAMLSRKLNAKVILFHAIPLNSVWWATNNEFVREAHTIQENIKEELIKAGVAQTKIENHVFYKFPLNKGITDFFRKSKVDIVVIGTKGIIGLKNVLLGNFALAMIERFSVPIIAVPPTANVETINSILYATDLGDTTKETKQLLPFSKALDAYLHIVHISQSNLVEDLKSSEKLRKIAVKADFDKLTFKVKPSQNLLLAIVESIKENQADLIVMFPKEKGILEEFIKGSVTEEISRNIEIPLLIIKKKIKYF
jgi:nucleotide-binding universal stress UspA family protein